MARRNQVSCLPAGASGAVLEMNTGAGEAAAAARLCPVLPGEPVHPAATPASTTPSPTRKIGLAAFVSLPPMVTLTLEAAPASLASPVAPARSLAA